MPSPQIEPTNCRHRQGSSLGGTQESRSFWKAAIHSQCRQVLKASMGNNHGGMQPHVGYFAYAWASKTLEQRSRA